MIEIWTDGGCEPNPGFGGFAAIVLMAGEAVEITGHAAGTTNNRMEMQAAIAGLTHCRPEWGPIVLHSDSAYLVNGITKWVAGWVARGWQRKPKRVNQPPEPILNLDLWQQIHELDQRLKVRWKHVRGHMGIRWNERADELATQARLEGLKAAT